MSADVWQTRKTREIIAKKAKGVKVRNVLNKNLTNTFL
jgi:hypothetical protein